MVRLKNKNRGFTLIEVLLSVAVLAVVSGPFLSLFLQGFLITQSAGMKTIAVSYSREGMELIKAQGFDKLVETIEGQHSLYPKRESWVEEGYNCFYEVQHVFREVQNGFSTESVEVLEITVYVNYFDRTDQEVVLTSFLSGR
ncbi:type IV pilus modification PilV family protein [Candidatus Contubernalis alkaliaceticus]|uniref:type IV pilus modification PilV family protein n=1 Tax=Candidatus Contubernalis alkaliaceticus TaxID=338645 RepID=UPI001F4C3CFF|nr:prepilin-type N-terminal cleavage/methylation domain-containing protein [Candidatus Contubernalis alkalaceticus]UNC92567.1 prepilin-type N-terminal cleavage/methylation domain-containing protein [Candidatus Contubernalis alkalaceticus]